MLDNTAASALLKEFYTPLQIETMFMSKFPTLAMLRKATDRGGKVWVVPVIHEELAGASRSFAQAQTNSASTALQAVEFGVTPTRNYLIGTVDGLTIASTRNDKSAYIKALRRTVDSCFRVLTSKLSLDLFRSQWGSLGTRGSATGSTITLGNKEDAVNFQVGDRIVTSASEASNTLRAQGSSAAGNIGVVTAIDYNSGILTFGDTVAGIWASSGNGDVLFRAGDRQDSATPTALAPASFYDYVPDAAPSTTLFGVTRTGSSRLGGTRYDGSGESRREALQRATTRVERLGGSPDLCVLNPTDWQELSIELGSAVRYVDIKAGTNGQIGFVGIQIATSAGPLKVISDAHQRVSRALLLQTDTWTLASLGDAPGFVNFEGGGEFLRLATADGIEVRTGQYTNLECAAPGWNCNVQLPTG